MKKRISAIHNLTGRSLLILLIAAGIAGGGCRPKAPLTAAGGEDAKAAVDPVAVEIATASQHSVDTVLSAQGTLTPAQGSSTRIAPSVAGRLAEVRVREGDSVQPGQVVALVDSRTQKALAQSAVAAVSAADAQARGAEAAVQASVSDQASSVRLAKLALSSTQLDRDNAIKQAQNALQSAQTDLNKTRAGARPQEIAQADLAIRQAQATRNRAETELTRIQKLFEGGVASKRQLEDAQTAVDLGQAAQESASQQASLVRAGARPEDLRAAELRVEGARETLRQAQSSGDAKVLQARAAVHQAEQAALQVAAKRQDARAMSALALQKRADLNAAQTTAGYAEVRAALGGRVIRRNLNPGDMADTTTPILEIANTDRLDLVASVPAEAGAGIRSGMSVRVTVAEVPGHDFPGSVSSVGQIDPQTNLMSVRIAVTNSGSRLRIGSFGTAKIVLYSNPRGIVIPKQAVITQDQKTVVYVVGADKLAHKKEVQVGSDQGEMVEIKSGVAAGDHVIRTGQYELTDGAAVKPASSTPAAGAAGGTEP